MEHESFPGLPGSRGISHSKEHNRFSKKTYFGSAAGCDLAKISKKLKMTIFDRFFRFYRSVSIDDR